jgi:hypothetical protein
MDQRYGPDGVESCKVVRCESMYGTDGVGLCNVVRCEVMYVSILCVCFVDRCLSFCHFSFSFVCVVCPSNNGFWLPLWYLQTFLTCFTILVLCVDGFLVISRFQSPVKLIGMTTLNNNWMQI